MDKQEQPREQYYTLSDINAAIDFGTKLGQTTGYFEGNDSWIDRQEEHFINLTLI